MTNSPEEKLHTKPAPLESLANHSCLAQKKTINISRTLVINPDMLEIDPLQAWRVIVPAGAQGIVIFRVAQIFLLDSGGAEQCFHTFQ